MGYLLKDLEVTKDIAASTIQELFRLFSEGALKPQIDSVYPYSKIREAMQRMHNRQNVGKVLLQPDSEQKNGVTEEKQSE